VTEIHVHYTFIWKFKALPGWKLIPEQEAGMQNEWEFSKAENFWMNFKLYQF